ncbi:UNVERIFIED_CONTAM: hypothetical protein HDU68_012774, partial [Siphonaria sp. JEL0065]
MADMEEADVIELIGAHERGEQHTPVPGSSVSQRNALSSGILSIVSRIPSVPQDPIGIATST